MDLSIFVDESGDFDINSKHSPYYIFSLIIHNQKNSIEREILRLDRHMEEKKFSKHAIHTAHLLDKKNHTNSIITKKEKYYLISYIILQRIVT